MTNDVPDTGLVKAFLPLKPGGTEPKPSCGNCPCGSRDAHGSGGQLVCTRFPPELVMHLKVHPVTGAPTQVPQVGFKPVNADMVCWEHPAMQVRMERAILAAAHRAAHPPMRVGSWGSDVNPISERHPEPAAVAEADGRKPGDET